MSTRRYPVSNRRCQGYVIIGKIGNFRRSLEENVYILKFCACSTKEIHYILLILNFCPRWGPYAPLVFQSSPTTGEQYAILCISDKLDNPLQTDPCFEVF